MRLLALLHLVHSFTEWQALTIRDSIKKYGPADAVFLDVVMAKNYAHADMQNRIVSIDARRFDCCPRTFARVVQHELAHCSGRMHNSVAGDIMNYSILVTTSGEVIDDEADTPTRAKFSSFTSITSP